jgi:AcrR family transcriptional regulator
VPQRLKDDVLEGIAAAALRVFARQGFAGATMADIARAARISTGNIYRYYRNKGALLRAVIPPEFVDRFTRLLRERVRAAAGTDDVRALPPSSPYQLAVSRLLDFAIEHRLRIIVLLGSAEGTRYAGFDEEVVQLLCGLSLAHFRALRPGLRVTAARRLGLELVYRNLVAALVAILRRFTREAEIREAVAGYSRYHLAGLSAYFSGCDE